MSGDSKKLQPIIIKRIKKGGHGAHGGAWKIAYADFVTAMMAFFLLMWLLGSTSEGDKKGIADYFASPLKVALLNSGSGAGDASHVIKGGGQDLTRSTGQVKAGETAAERKTIKVVLEEILYVEGVKDYVKIVLANQKIMTKVSIGNFLKELPEDRFVQVHKSFIVAKKKISAYTAHDVEIGELEIPIGRVYKEAFLKEVESNRWKEGELQF